MHDANWLPNLPILWLTTSTPAQVAILVEEKFNFAIVAKMYCTVIDTVSDQLQDVFEAEKMYVGQRNNCASS